MVEIDGPYGPHLTGDTTESDPSSKSDREWSGLNDMASLTRNAANDATLDNICSEKHEYFKGSGCVMKKKLKIDGP